MTWQDSIRLASKYGMKHIEFSVDPLGNGEAYTDEFLNDIKQAMYQNEMICSIHCVSGINLAERVKKIRSASIELLIDSVNVAEKIGAKWVTVHLGNIGNPSQNKRLERFNIIKEVLESMGGLLREKGVRLGVENLERYPDNVYKSNLLNRLEDFEQISEIFDDYIGCVIDIGHLMIHNTVDEQSRLLEKMLPMAYAFHIHWNNGFEDSHYALERNHQKMKKHFVEAIKTYPNLPCLIECYSANHIHSTYQYLNSINKEDITI